MSPRRKSLLVLFLVWAAGLAMILGGNLQPGRAQVDGLFLAGAVVTVWASMGLVKILDGETK